MKYRSSPRDARLDDVFRCAKRHRSVAIVTAGMHAPEKTRGMGKVVLLVDRQRSSYCREPLSRGHMAEIRPVRTIPRLPGMLKVRRSRDQFGRLMFFERGLGVRANPKPPTSTQSPTDLGAGGAGRALPLIAGLTFRP